jgi:hypothetical protein
VTTAAGVVRGFVPALARALATLSPRSPTPDEELRRAVDFLDWRVDPGTVLAAGDGVAVPVATLSLSAVAVAPPGVRLPALALAVGVVAGVVHAVHRLPVALAALRRTTALGAAPGLVARAALRMRVTPTVEAASAFAADTGEGPLAAALDAHVRRARGTPRSGFASFADEWARWFPSLRRAAGLFAAAAAAPAGERARTLDRATEAVLATTRERAADFAGTVRGPTTALYAFGVLVPLATVAVLPAARVAGLAVPAWLLVVVYDLALPAVTVAAGAWLLVRRPVAFPPPAVGVDHPDVVDRRLMAPLVGVGGAVLAGLAATRLARWTAPVAAVGVGLGVALVARYRPVVRVRERVRAVEEGLPDALYVVGRRVAEGTAVERAVELAAEEAPGPTGERFAAAARVGRRLRVDVETAFLGEHGAFASVPSPRARAAARLLATAGREGEPAGAAVVAVADHLSELASVEREARRELRRVTGTLANTAAAFGPLVAGATVALAGSMTGVAQPGDGVAGATGVGGAQPVSTAVLGLAVGGYVLFLAVALTALSVGLERGLDGALVGYRVGLALLVATSTYLGAYALAGLAV